MKKIRFPSIILLVLLLVVLMGCNQPKVRRYECPISLEGMAELFHENEDTFDSFAANLQKNVTSDNMSLRIIFK